MKKKIVSPCFCDTYSGQARAFAKITLSDKRNLSISGVVGPTSNGNCKGSAGQCVDEIRNGTPTECWSVGMLKKFCDIWDTWHLNDMRPYCKHQKELGWDTLASKKVNIYHYRMNVETLDKKKAAEKAALVALHAGEIFTPTAEQVKYATMSYSLESPEELHGEMLSYYEPEKLPYTRDHGPIDTKTLGWLYPKDHPDGILCKSCPVCGYRYGSKWLREEVPEEVLEWLFALPDTTVEPAWV